MINDGSSSNEDVVVNNCVNNDNIINTRVTIEYKTYSHNGDGRKVYFVPENYDLPKKTALINAFRLFVNGDIGNKSMVNDQLVDQPVCPFYFWTAKTVLKNIVGKV